MNTVDTVRFVTHPLLESGERVQLIWGVEMMGVMTAQPPLPLTPSGGVPFGAVAALVQDDDGGRVFIRGELSFVWDAGDEGGRRLAAVQLVRVKAASLLDVAAARFPPSRCGAGARSWTPQARLAWPGANADPRAPHV